MAAPDTLDALLATIRLLKGVLRVWEDWARRHIRQQEEQARKTVKAGDRDAHS